MILSFSRSRVASPLVRRLSRLPFQEVLPRDEIRCYNNALRHLLGSASIVTSSTFLLITTTLFTTSPEGSFSVQCDLVNNASVWDFDCQLDSYRREICDCCRTVSELSQPFCSLRSHTPFRRIRTIPGYRRVRYDRYLLGASLQRKERQYSWVS